jgi:hypothetical protein
LCPDHSLKIVASGGRGFHYKFAAVVHRPRAAEVEGDLTVTGAGRDTVALGASGTGLVVKGRLKVRLRSLGNFLDLERVQPNSYLLFLDKWPCPPVNSNVME